MGLLLIHALTGGRWGYAIRPLLVCGMATLPLLIPVLIPLMTMLAALYPWARSGAALHLDNRFYLNLPFFVGRIIVYLIVWFGLAGLILRALRRPAPELALARLAPAGLIVLALTVTYAAVDMTMSLDPRFVSSVYGMIEISEMGLLALSVSVFAAALGLPPDEGTVHSLGRLLLGLVVLWAYLDFMQVLIIWQSDLADEAPWYIVRSTGGWGIAAAVVAAGHFVLPFFALIWPQVQRSRRGIAAVAALLVLTRDNPWLVAGGAGVRARLWTARCAGHARTAWYRCGVRITRAVVADDAERGALPCLKSFWRPRDMKRATSARHSSGSACRCFSFQ